MRTVGEGDESNRGAVNTHSLRTPDPSTSTSTFTFAHIGLFTRSHLHEDLDDFALAVQRGEVQRRLPRLRDGVHARPELNDKAPRHVREALLARAVQRRVVWAYP